MTIIEFVDGVLHLSLSPAQRTLLKSFYGEPLTPEETDIFRECADREYEPREYSEMSCIAGARSGKDSRIAVAVTLFEIFNRDHSYLHSGEVGIALIVAQDQRAGGIAFGYLKAVIEGSDLLNSHVTEIRKNEIETDLNVTLAVYPCTFRASRGTTCIVAVADEVSFWRSEDGSANLDKEVLRSIARGQANVPNAKLLKLSTPYSKSGVLWDDYCKRHELLDCLVWRAPTSLMNPSISARFLEKERQKDPIAFAREYLAEFSDDAIGAFLPRNTIEALVIRGRNELPFDRRFDYVSFCDPSGGSNDSMTLAIGHVHRRESGGSNTFVLDLLKEIKPPFNPDTITMEFASDLKRYHCREVRGDAYGAGWVKDRFAAHGITYRNSEWNRSELYIEFLALANSGKIELLDNERLTQQFCGLQRRTSAMGRDSVDHVNGGHDDAANAAAGCLVAAALSPVSNTYGGIF